MDSVITQVTKETAGGEPSSNGNKASLRRRFNSPVEAKEQEIPKPSSSTKSNFFRKLLNCWCCGRTRRSVRNERNTAVIVNNSDHGIEDDLQRQLPPTNFNGGVGDNQLPSSNSQDTNSLIQHSPPPGKFYL